MRVAETLIGVLTKRSDRPLAVRRGHFLGGVTLEMCNELRPQAPVTERPVALDRHIQSSKIIYVALLLLMLKTSDGDLVSPSA